MVSDIELDARAVALEAMETVCSDCGHRCGHEGMVQFCEAYQKELEEARETVGLEEAVK